MIRPTATATHGDDGKVRPTMNGVQPPLRGSHDMDGEVLAGQPERGRSSPSPVLSQLGGHGIPSTGANASGTEEVGARNGPQPSTLSSAAAHQGGAQATQQNSSATDAFGQRPGAQQGVLTRMLRAVQTLPAAMENLVASDLPGKPRAIRQRGVCVCANPFGSPTAASTTGLC